MSFANRDVFLIFLCHGQTPLRLCSGTEYRCPRLSALATPGIAVAHVNGEGAMVFEFGAFRLDAAERLLFRDGERIPLPPKAVDALVLLLRNHGHVVTKEQLFADVWPNVVVEENSLARTISLLRKTLASNDADESCIETIPRRGYRFLPTPRLVARDQVPPDGAQRLAATGDLIHQEADSQSTGTAPHATSDRGSSWLPRLGVALAAFAAGALALTALLVMSREPREETTRAATVQTAQLAVLPFELAEADPSADYLRLAVPDAITTRLANVRALRVRPTVTVRRVAQRESDPQRIGQALGVEHVLTGILYSSGAGMQLNLQLVRVSDGVPVWGENIQVPSSELARLQDHPFVENIIDAMRVQITAMERERLFSQEQIDPLAYKFYLVGRADLAHHTEQAMRSAAQSFQAAIDRDTSFAAAYAGLARAAAEMTLRFVSEQETEQWHNRALAAAQEAVRLDPHAAEAHEAMAAVYRKTEFEWDLVLKHGLRALELNLNLEQPHFYIAGAYYHLGLFEEAVAAVERGIEANPAGDLVEGKRARGVAQLLDGRFAEARATLEEVRPLSDPRTIDHYLASAIYYAGDVDKALEILNELSASSSASASSRARATKAAVLAQLGKRDEAEKLALQVGGGATPDAQGSSSRTTYLDHHVAHGLATAWAQLGHADRAVAWLKNAAETGFPCYPWFERDSLLNPIRSDPAVREFLGSMQADHAEVVRRTPLYRKCGGNRKSAIFASSCTPALLIAIEAERYPPTAISTSRSCCVSSFSSSAAHVSADTTSSR